MIGAMQVMDLSSFDPNSLFETDLVIIGGGPAGLTIAAASNRRKSSPITCELGRASRSFEREVSIDDRASIRTGVVILLSL